MSWQRSQATHQTQHTVGPSGRAVPPARARPCSGAAWAGAARGRPGSWGTWKRSSCLFTAGRPQRQQGRHAGSTRVLGCGGGGGRSNRHICARPCANLPRTSPLPGLRQSLATAGALIGSSVASAVFISTGKSYVTTFTVAIIPPAIALVWLTGVSHASVMHAPHAPAPSPSRRPRPFLRRRQPSHRTCESHGGNMRQHACPAVSTASPHPRLPPALPCPRAQRFREELFGSPEQDAADAAAKAKRVAAAEAGPKLNLLEKARVRRPARRAPTKHLHSVRPHPTILPVQPAGDALGSALRAPRKTSAPARRASPQGRRPMPCCACCARACRRWWARSSPPTGRR